MPAEIWTTRVWCEFRAGNLTRAYRDVLLTLQTFRGAGGLCIPSHATLADRAKCCARTAQRALQQAQQLGLVTWVERRVRAGWRWLRTSNAYRLTLPDTAVEPGMRPITARQAQPATNGQHDRGGENSSKKEALRQMLREAAAMPDLLAMRRAANEASRLTALQG